MRIARVISLALLLTFAGAADARAGFLVPLIAGSVFAATTAGAILTFGLNVVAGFGASLLLNKVFAKKPQQASSPKGVGGVELDMRVDAQVPFMLLVGRATTGGSLAYAKTYGRRGDIDNSDLIEIVSLADHPCHGLVRVMVEGQDVELLEAEGDRGNPIAGYDGKLAMRFFDGSQAAADPFTVAALGGASNMRWTEDHLGTGITYARQHSLYQQELVPGRLRWRYVIDGIRLYDPRKDSTVFGGAGAHRFGDLDTHEFTANLALIAYNILRGIRVKDHTGAPIHFYGLEDTSAAQFPLDVWFAAMNECDLPVEVAGGGTEPQYHGGGEISIDTEPLEASREILKSCGGRLVENGGIFKLYVGPPGLPVLTINDDMLLASTEDTFRPILPLERRINYITGSYTSPADGYTTKVAPDRGRPDWEAIDRRRLPTDLSMPMVQSGRQAQQLMEQAINRLRRQRKHLVPLPPIAFICEPGDVIAWNSVRNGYVGKELELDAAEYQTNLNTIASLTECDPSDYDPLETLLPEADGRLVTTLPAPKVITGFEARGVKLQGDAGTVIAAIEVAWTDPEDGDAIGVSWEIRQQERPDNLTAGRADGAEIVRAELVHVTGGLQSLTVYEIRVRFISANGYPTEWSLWIPVTTPDVRYTFSDLSEQLRYESLEKYQAILADTQEHVRQLAQLVAEVDAAGGENKEEIDRKLLRERGKARAEIREALRVAVGPNSAVAEMLQELRAALGNVEANMTARFVVGVTPDGALALYELRLNAGNAFGSQRLIARDDGQGGVYVDIEYIANRLFIRGPNGNAIAPFIVEAGPPQKIYLNGDVLIPQSVSGGFLDFLSGNIRILRSDQIEAEVITAEKVVSNSLMRFDFWNSQDIGNEHLYVPWTHITPGSGPYLVTQQNITLLDKTVDVPNGRFQFCIQAHGLNAYWLRSVAGNVPEPVPNMFGTALTLAGGWCLPGVYEFLIDDTVVLRQSVTSNTEFFEVTAQRLTNVKRNAGPVRFRARFTAGPWQMSMGGLPSNNSINIFIRTELSVLQLAIVD